MLLLIAWLRPEMWQETCETVAVKGKWQWRYLVDPTEAQMHMTIVNTLAWKNLYPYMANNENLTKPTFKNSLEDLRP